MQVRWSYAALVLLTSNAAFAATPGTATTPYTGITYQVWTDAAIPARIHVVTLDATSGEINLVATAEAQRGKTPSAFASEIGAQIVINGDSFAPDNFVPTGLALGASALWSISEDDAQSGFISFYRAAAGNVVTISPPEQVVTDPAEQLSGVVGGKPMVVRGGLAIASADCTDAIALPCLRAPRTAVAVSADGNTMWLVVVDGWQQDSLGMTAVELGQFLQNDLEVHEALMLDSGSASALYIQAEAGLVSSPSDGVERIVANHIAVKFGVLTPGTIRGVVRERDIVSGMPLAGTVLMLDDGQQTTYDGNVTWSFQTQPRWACVTASLAGYRDNSKCRQVQSGADSWASIALFPNSDFIDGGPGDLADAGPQPDSGPIPDGGLGIDDAGVGPDGGGGGGGGCGVDANAGRKRSSGLFAAFLLVVLSWRRRSLALRSGPGRTLAK